MYQATDLAKLQRNWIYDEDKLFGDAHNLKLISASLNVFRLTSEVYG